MSTHGVNVAVAGIVVPAAVAVASWSLRDDLSILVSILAVIWYVVQFGSMLVRWIKAKLKR